MLRKLVNYAYYNVPFYHKKFRKANILPADIKNFDDLELVPITTKQELQMTPLVERIGKDVDITKCVHNRTGGSTGIPLLTLEDKKCVGIQGAYWLNLYFGNGIRLNDKIAIIRDPVNFPKKVSITEKLGILKKERISAFLNTKEQLGRLLFYDPDVIVAYPSSLSFISEIENIDGEIKPRLIFTFGEILDKRKRILIQSKFGSEIFDYYGCAELNLMAWECKSHSGYHMNLNTLIMEFIQNGEKVDYGEQGKIIGTYLINYSMPLIRYNVGDIGVPIKEKCSCGVTLPLMQSIEGRSDDLLITTDGRLISPLIFFPYPFENFEGIKQYRIIQEEKDKIVIELAITKDFSKNSKKILNRATSNLKKLFGESLNVEYQLQNNLQKDTSGKFRSVISKVSGRIDLNS
jgi:phenylacetate-CoA ligase